jgi:dCTP deaminase
LWRCARCSAGAERLAHSTCADKLPPVAGTAVPAVHGVHRTPPPLPPPHPSLEMTIMSDRWITRMAQEHRMIEPFEGRQVRKGVISYGVSSYGYDMRVAREFRIFTNVLNSIVDPKAFDPKSFVEFDGDVCIVPPNSFALGRSVEYFRIPRNILTVTVGKSTYARCGIITNVTPFEPEWEGFVTLEISNTTPLPAKIYANEGIAQVLFFRGEEEPEVSYKDKGGKYQSQVGVTLPRL